MIASAEAKYGAPREISLQFEISESELALVRGSRKHERSHDITLFIFDDQRIALIRKPTFPPGAYRAPSGGLEPGEPLERGARREAREETGLEIKLERYLLRVRANFTFGLETEPWTTHVFKARVVSGSLAPVDVSEIEAAKWGTIAELQGPIRDVLVCSGTGLLAYRVALTDATVEVLSELEEKNAD
ncbi:MAG: NUDIX hydrolase [Chloroflexi bacterium]|nr:NUDIX hydrolase [Chloroflexota bacterium]